jgi:hypothetical protein
VVLCTHKIRLSYTIDSPTNRIDMIVRIATGFAHHVLDDQRKQAGKTTVRLMGRVVRALL